MWMNQWKVICHLLLDVSIVDSIYFREMDMFAIVVLVVCLACISASSNTAFGNGNDIVAWSS